MLHICERKIKVTCPVCNGTKKIIYNNYKISCKQCDITGSITAIQTVVAPRKVKIRRIIVSIWNDVITIKYKVDPVGEYTTIRNRSESTLFKTLEECEQKCKEINQCEVAD